VPTLNLNTQHTQELAYKKLLKTSDEAASKAKVEVPLYLRELRAWYELVEERKGGIHVSLFLKGEHKE
jgi:hypothetical protein